jgi:hypothetical protein
MRRLIAIPALAILSACVAGSPAQFKGDVDAFAEGVGNAKTAYEQQREDYVTYLESLEREVLLTTEPRPTLLDGATLGACGNGLDDWKDEWSPESGIEGASYQENLTRFLKSCQPHKEVEGRAQAFTLKAGDPTPMHSRLARALVSYASAMQRLTAVADDRKAFEDAASESRDNFTGLLASARNLAKEAGVAEPLDIDDELTVVSNALIQAIAAGLEAKRRAALAEIAEANQKAVEAAADALAAIARYYHLSALSEFVERYSDAVGKTAHADIKNSAGSYGSAVDDTLLKYQAMIEYAKTDPGQVFNEMKDAHRALVKRLNDPKARLGELAGSIETFHQTSKDVLEAIRGIRVKFRGGDQT